MRRQTETFHGKKAEMAVVCIDRGKQSNKRINPDGDERTEILNSPAAGVDGLELTPAPRGRSTPPTQTSGSETPGRELTVVDQGKLNEPKYIIRNLIPG